jgi:ankyrin repeat protein
VDVLLAHGASVDAINNLGESALMWAARSGNPESIKVLLMAGANSAQVDQAGHNARFYLRNARDSLTFDKAVQERYDLAGSIPEQK